MSSQALEISLSQSVAFVRGKVDIGEDRFRVGFGRMHAKSAKRIPQDKPTKTNTPRSERLRLVAKKYWLLKSEPDCYSIDDLAADADQTTFWDGVRNYQARNFMRDEMSVGDGVLFYHSNADPSGVAGVAKIAAAAYVDHTQFDKKHEHYDPKSKPENPSWLMVDVQFVQKFDSVIPLADLKQESALEGMELLRKGSRLSVQPVSKAHFDYVVKLGKKRK